MMSTRVKLCPPLMYSVDACNLSLDTIFVGPDEGYGPIRSSPMPFSPVTLHAVLDNEDDEGPRKYFTNMNHGRLERLAVRISWIHPDSLIAAFPYLQLRYLGLNFARGEKLLSVFLSTTKHVSPILVCF